MSAFGGGGNNIPVGKGKTESHENYPLLRYSDRIFPMQRFCLSQEQEN